MMAAATVITREMLIERVDQLKARAEALYSEWDGDVLGADELVSELDELGLDLRTLPIETIV